MEPGPQGRDGALFERPGSLKSVFAKQGRGEFRRKVSFPKGTESGQRIPLASSEMIAGSGLPSLSLSTVPLLGPMLFIQRSHGPPRKEVGETPLSYRHISLLKALGSPPGLFFFLASPGRWVLTPLSSVPWSPFTLVSLSLVCPRCSPWLLR